MPVRSVGLARPHEYPLSRLKPAETGVPPVQLAPVESARIVPCTVLSPHDGSRALVLPEKVSKLRSAGLHSKVSMALLPVFPSKVLLMSDPLDEPSISTAAPP